MGNLLRRGIPAGFAVAVTAIGAVCGAGGPASADTTEAEVVKTYLLGTSADGVTRTSTFQCPGGARYVKGVKYWVPGNVNIYNIPRIKSLDIKSPPSVPLGTAAVSWSTPKDNYYRPPSIRFEFTCSNVQPAEVSVKTAASGTAKGKGFFEESKFSSIAGTCPDGYSNFRETFLLDSGLAHWVNFFENYTKIGYIFENRTEQDLPIAFEGECRRP